MAVFEATIKAKLWGQDCVNVLHFDRPNANQADMAALAGQINNRWIGQAVFLSTQFLNYYVIEVRHISVTPWAPVIVPVNQSGQKQGVFPPAFLCGVFQKKTAFQGKRNRGRCFISGFHTGDMTNGGVWSFNCISQMQSVANAWKGWFVGANPQSGFKLIIHPRDVVGTIGTDVIDIVPRSYPGTQVRRNLGRGT